MNTLINILLFQIGWFACVLGAAYGFPFAGTGVALTIATLHVLRANRPRQELKLILVSASIGTVWDSVVASTGLITYPNGVLVAGTAPIWIAALWVIFATTINVSLRWLHNRYLLGAIFGAVGGPLAYLAGAKLGALVLLDTTWALGLQAVGWAVLMPLLLRIARRLDGITPARPGSEPCLI